MLGGGECWGRGGEGVTEGGPDVEWDKLLRLRTALEIEKIERVCQVTKTTGLK